MSCHPVTGEPVVALVSGGDAQRLDRLRCDDTITVVLRAGWKWVAVDGHADLVGPYDDDVSTVSLAPS